MTKTPIIQILWAALCLIVSSLPVQAQFSGGAIALTESKLAWRSWHITNKRGADFLLRVSGNTVYATNNIINDASTFVVDAGPDDSNWTTPDSRWFYIRSLSTGKYLTVASSGDLPRAVTLGDYDEENFGQQFRLIATISPSQYKLRSRLSASGPDLVLEVNAAGVLQADSPKLDPSSEQKFAFNLTMPRGDDRTYALVGTFKGRYMSDNGIKVDGTPAVQKKDSDESGIWKLTHQGSNYYLIQNNLTKHYLTAPEGSVHGTIPIMTATPFGDRSLWLLDPGDVNFRISNKAFDQLFVSATSMPSGEALRLRTAADPYRSWVVSLMPGEMEIAPGDFDQIADGTLSSECFGGYGALFKRALCERIGLNPAQAELYFGFIREAIAAKMGAGRVDEILQKIVLDNPGHRVDLALMVRYYLTEVLPGIPYGQWSPAAQAAVTEWQNKVQAIRSSYGARLVSTWDAYVAEQGNNISFADVYFFWLDGDGYEWPSYYQATAAQEPQMRDYVRGAVAFGERNNTIVGSTAIGASVAFSIVYASSAGIKFLVSQLQAFFSVTVKLLGINMSFPMTTLLAAAGPPLSVAVFAAASLSMQVMEVIEFQDFEADFAADYLWSQQPVNIPATLAGNDLLARIKLLSDLDFIIGAPVPGEFQYQTNDNFYLPPFTLSCMSELSLALDENGQATLTPAMAGFVVQSCGMEMQYFLSKSQFDCDDLGPNQVVFVAWTRIDENADSYVQRCTLTVQIVDEIAPTLTCPGNQTLVLGPDCTASIPDYTSLATNVSDNCGALVVSQTPEPGTLLWGGGDITVTLRVFAANGATTTCTFILTKVDNTPPLAVCPPTQTLALASDCTAAIPDYRNLATTYDACGIASVVQAAPPGFIVSGAGSITAALIVTDVNNNVSQCSFTITKVDSTPPTISCPATQTLVLGANCTAALPDYTGLASTGDNCGVQGVTQSPAAGTTVANSGHLTVTLTVTDINGNSTSCSFTVNKVDQTPPAVQCFPQTFTFNGETQFALNAAELVDASDNCGVAGIALSASSITCAQLGQVIPITVTVTDINGNESTCISPITVNGLPCGWRQTPDGINCTNGSSTTYNAASGVYTLTSTNCYTANFSSDVAAFAQRTLCGDGSITAQVTGMTGSLGWAGVVMRESNVAGAKKVQLTTNMAGNQTRREVRTTTNGVAMPQQLVAQGRFWLRIVRQGHQFVGYHSSNGVQWFQVFVATVNMPDCIEIGLVASNYTANSTITATFAHVNFAGSSSLGADNLTQDVASNPSPELAVFPNPTSGEIFLDLGSYAGQALTLEVLDLAGRLLAQTKLDSAPALESLDLSTYQAGLYLLRVRAAGQPDQIRRVVRQ